MLARMAFHYFGNIDGIRFISSVNRMWWRGYGKSGAEFGFAGNTIVS
jgi:hypothetical protein